MLPASFTSHLVDLATQAGINAVAASASGVVPRAWQIPSTAPTDGTDIQDPLFFAVACDRTQLNYLCIQAYEEGAQLDSAYGRLGIVMAAKTAIDYQGAYERAAQARYASPLRCRAWASARRAGHYDPTYGVFAVVDQSLEAICSAATSVSNNPAVGTGPDSNS